MQHIKKGFTDSEHLQEKVESHYAHHIATYGSDVLKPKWHPTLHLKNQLDEDDDIVYDTFCNERDHKNAKAFAESITKLKSFHKSLMIRSVALQCDRLAKFHERPSLSANQWSEKMGAWVSLKLSSNGMHLGEGDIVLVRDNGDCEYVKVKLCGMAEDKSLFLLGVFCEVVKEGKISAVVRPSEELRIVWVNSLVDIEHAACWKKIERGKIRVLKHIRIEA